MSDTGFTLEQADDAEQNDAIVDDDGTYIWPYVKLAFGDSGVQTRVDANNPLPVTGTITTGGLTDAELRATAIDVATGLTQPTTPADTQPISGDVRITDNTDFAGITGDRLHVRDHFTGIEHEEDQTGAGAVLTFTLAVAGDFVMVDCDNTDSEDTATYRARATLDGSTPTATLGFVCRSGQTTYLPFPMTGVAVKVFAPTGTTVAAQVGRYTA